MDAALPIVKARTMLSVDSTQLSALYLSGAPSALISSKTERVRMLQIYGTCVFSSQL